MTDIVTLTNLTKTYNGIPALRDVVSNEIGRAHV